MIQTVTSVQLVREGIILGLILLAGGLIGALVRALIGPSGPRDRLLGLFLRRLAVPGSVLVLSVLLRDRILPLLPEVELPLSLEISSTFPVRLGAWIGFWGLICILRLMDLILVGVYRKRQMEFPLPNLLHSVALGVLYASVFLAILSGVLGVDISPVLGASALLTAILGFALQGVLGNLMSGLSIHLVRTVEIGDWILVDGLEGQVVDTSWRETRIQNIEGDIVAIPNSHLASSAVENYSQPDERRMHEVLVRATYHDRPSRVIQAMVDAAQETLHVLENPEPWATVHSFDDYAVHYRLRFWTRRFWDRVRIDGEVQRLVWYKFHRAGIEIPFPMSDVLLNDWMAVVQGQKRLVPPPEDQAELIRDLLDCRLLQGPEVDGKPSKPLFDRDQLKGLVQGVRRVVYAPGEILCRQGEPGESCWVVVQGRIQGRIEFTESSGRKTLTFESGPGDLFGEMSLYTAAPRTATGTFQEEATLLEIDRETFARMLATSSTFSEAVEETAQERAAQNQEFLEHLLEVDAEELRRRMSRRSIRARLGELVELGRGLLGGK